MNTAVTLNPYFTRALVTVTQELHATMPRDELLKLFAQVFRDLIPDTLQCFRVVKEEGGALDVVYANGRLKLEERETFKVTQRSMEGLLLTDEQREEVFHQGNVLPVDEYATIFEDGNRGFCFLLCDRNALYGIVNFEYPRSPSSMENDRAAVLPFIHLFVAALRNARLMSETIRLKEYWEKLLYSANAPVVVVDRDGRITLMNRVFEELTGMTRDAIRGKEFLSIVPASSRTRLLRNILSAVSGEPSTNIEMRFPRHGDEEDVAHIAFNSASVYNSFGQVEGVIFVGQDLTLIKDLQRQIIHSEKLSTLGQIAAGVAHELNNPLTSITVYTNYLLQKLSGTISPSDLQKLESIGEGARRISSFTKDLVSYARPSEDHPEPLDLVHLLKRSVSFCEPTIASTGAAVTMDLPDRLPPFFGIEGQMEQVFVNLVTNACHALDKPGGQVQIRAVCPDDQQIVISVSDNGRGIPQKNLSRIFDPFFTTKNVGEGTGLGLSIVRNILENHSAKIDVQSEEGKGTTFAITLRVS